MTDDAKKAAKIIAKLAPNFTPRLGIVLGSGLGALAEQIENPIVISYEDLPGFPPCSVSGHGSQLFLGLLEGVPVACLQGRVHFYEGMSNAIAQTMTRTLKLIGCETLFSTNSSGSLRPEVTPGNLVVINDHINFQFTNPLAGPNDSEFGQRFVGMDETYDPLLRQQLFDTAKALKIDLTEGVYFGVLGPTFETPAEIRAFRTLGGDVIGMSTIPEVICARHCGLRVMAIAVITNMAAGMSDEKLSHEGTLNGAEKARHTLIQLVQSFVRQYPQSNAVAETVS